MRISDWSSDVCSSDLLGVAGEIVRLLPLYSPFRPSFRTPFRRRHFHRGDEVAVEVLLCGQNGAPRRQATGAVVQGADHGLTLRIGGGTHARVPGGRPGDPDLRGRGRNAAIEPAALHHAPFSGGIDPKSTRLNSSNSCASRMPSSAY